MKKVLLGVLGTLLLICLTTWLWILPSIESKILDGINERLGLYNASLEWDDVTWSPQGVRLHGVRFHHPRAVGHLGLVNVQLAWTDWVGGRPRVMAIHLENPTLSIRRTTAHTSDDESDPRPSMDALVVPDVGPIHVKNGVLQFIDSETIVLGVDHVDATVTLATDQVHLSARGRTMGTWLQSSECELEAQADLTDKTVRVDLIGAETDVPCLQIQRDGITLSLEQTSVTVDVPQDTVRAQTIDVLAEAFGYQARMNSADILMDDDGLSITLNTPVLTGSDSRPDAEWSQESSVAKTATDKPADWLQALSNLDIPRHLRIPNRVNDWLNSPMSIQWTHAQINLETMPTITDGSGQLAAGRVSSQWSIFGGTTLVNAEWDQNLGDFHSLHIKTAKLDLPQAVDSLHGSGDAHPIADFSPGGTVDFEIHFSRPENSATQPKDTVGWEYTLHVRNGRLFVPSVSKDPLTRINILTQGKGRFSPSTEEFEDRSSINLNGVGVSTHLNIKDTLSAPHIEFKLRGDRVRCQDVVDALPEGLLGAYDRIAVSGKIKPRVDLDWPVLKPENLKLRFKSIIAPCSVTSLKTQRSKSPMVSVDGRRARRRSDVAWLNESFKLKVREGTSGKRRIFVGPGTDSYVDYHTLPPYVGAAAYLTEEILFPRNRALDPGLIRRALRLNLKKKRFVYGGSTVTQQLVKNLFLTRKKTLARKLQEILIAKRVTQEVSRDRVLALYLNCIEFGPDIFGIGPAAEHYFQKHASELTPREAVFLAMIKPKPSRGEKMRKRGRTMRTRYWTSRTEEIFKRLVDKGFLTQAEADAEKPYELVWNEGIYQDPSKPIPVENEEPADP